MAKAEFKYVHPLGEKIRRYRKLRGWTQKELAEKCQLNESTVRNYELGNRYPDQANLRTIADALGIDQHALADPDPTNVFGAIQILFDMEEQYGLIPETEEDGTVHLVLRDLPEDADPQQKLVCLKMKESIRLWSHIRRIYDEGNLLDEEYTDWKSRYPDFIGEDQKFGYVEDPETEKQLNAISDEIAGRKTVNTAPPKSAKRPRKAHI